MSMIDWLIVGFLAFTGSCLGLAAWAVDAAIHRIRQKWTCEARGVPSPSILESFDGGTI